VFFAVIIASALGQSICDRYVGTGNASALVSFAVNGVLGYVKTDPILPQWFNGSYPSGSPNLLAGGSAFTNFFNGVVEFFELALGCTDNSVVPYTGNVTAAHIGLNIGYNAFSAFNGYVCQTLSGAGFLANDTAAVAVALNGLRGICTATDCANICNRYSVPCNTNNNALVSSVVNATVMGVLATPLVQFFNGSISGKTNYLTNGAAFTTLFNHLVQFFGGALGCTDGSITAYGGDLAAAHAGFGITVDQFNQFNNILLGVLTASGVSAADVLAVSGVLNTTQGSIVTGSGSSGNNGGSSGNNGGSSGNNGGSSAVKTTTTSSSSTGGAVSMIVASLISLLLVVLI